MPPDLRQRFERLLFGTEEWAEPEQRRALLNSRLRDHKIWDDLYLSGSTAAVTHRLLDLYEEHGPQPFLLLLLGLREWNQANPERLREIEAIEARLRSQMAQRPRGKWNGPPYIGLDFFDLCHAPIFFGREAEVDQLIRILATTEQGRRFTVVVGASGSGKSSLVRAGLWARLASGQVPELPGSEHWLISTMTPSDLDYPEDSLRAALHHALSGRPGYKEKREIVAGMSRCSLAETAERLLGPGGARWLLILDQMEELFSPEHKQEGAAFLDRTIEGSHASAQGQPSRFQVLATLRADFFHHCLEHPPLRRVVSREGGQLPLGAPGRLALEHMVSGPLTEVELPEPWILDPTLAHALAADAERQPGGLTLMAFALQQLYERCRHNRRLDVETYRAADFGGLSGAIARRADATLQAIGGDGGALERVFVRLVRVNQDDAPTRRRAPISAWDDDPESRKLIEAFRKAGLLVADRGRKETDGPLVEVAHEALLEKWPRLAGWIDSRREGFRLAERVRTEAHAWMEGDAKWRHKRPWDGERIEEMRARLSQLGLLEDLLADPHVARLLTPERDWLLEEIRTASTTHLRRRDIGHRLSEIVDRRAGVGVREDGTPDILWRGIPRGEVEIEQRGRFVVAPFYMAAFPVTIAQFRAFLDARDGYESDHWWKNLQHENPDAAWGSDLMNHPVTDVSWYDATAFCRWLSSRLGFEVRLPDEQEWQWAAQSAQASFAYPWGADWRKGVANTAESDVRGTTAVGMYPQGDSLQEVSDLAGNVWEWCRNLHGDPKQRDTQGKQSRVLRGGSWYALHDFARAAFRFHLHPDDRNGNFGFRVVCSAPIAGR